MSIRSAIVIELKKEDIGKSIKFDKNKLPCKLSEWNCYGNETDKEKSEEVELVKPYIGIYCHNDGDLSGVGEVLKEKFTNYDDVLNLIVGGFCSVVWFDEVRHYANRANEEWEHVKPIQGDTPFEVGDKIDHCYLYLFENDKWSVREGNDFYDYDEDSIIS